MKTVTFFVLVLGVCALAFSNENKELDDVEEVDVHSRDRREVRDEVEEAFSFQEEKKNLGLRIRRDVAGVFNAGPKHVGENRYESETNYGNARPRPLRRKPKNDHRGRKNRKYGKHRHHKGRHPPVNHRSSGKPLNTEIESSVYNSAHKTPTNSGIQTSMHTKVTAASGKSGPQTVVMVPPNKGFSSDASKKTASDKKAENKGNDKPPSPPGHEVRMFTAV
ncbi:uncharacterized protein LOC103314486 [Tribolium castaneum]|uniref:Uncharacterized protein n=1 Tax=Tribolium castaneum TaxID=7070 RepID=D6X515_TRICA|nr:PREDICTED: uncharacterized protein LOC103314486 [Tribolium castaneum]EEZ97610.1 hypothetical protein TcasGA2_TC011481 [Tribolium castaneum]|eukprot:XP_008198946.1 PREDICTED: uncharacterized protein LOC103314486 [Tribolium castaneum]